MSSGQALRSKSHPFPNNVILLYKYNIATFISGCDGVHGNNRGSPSYPDI
jgi:hypothetical protein